MPTLTDPDTGRYVIFGLSALGGLLVSKIVLEQVFVEGLTSEERRNILALAGGAAALYALTHMVDLGEYKAWVDPLHLVTEGE